MAIVEFIEIQKPSKLVLPTEVTFPLVHVDLKRMTQLEEYQLLCQSERLIRECEFDPLTKDRMLRRLWRFL